MKQRKCYYDEKNGSSWSKGCFPVLTKSSRSSNISGPTPSISATSSTILESNHNKQHNKAGNESALKILI